MKKQKAVSTPTQAIDLTFDFHGFEIVIKDFRKDISLDNSNVIYLAMDGDGQVSWFQYLPEPDLKHKEFDSGTHPDNALDEGSSCGMYYLKSPKLPISWDKSVIKYTIEV
jgi:hypothetical protein